jgi:hypothetical protein
MRRTRTAIVIVVVIVVMPAAAAAAHVVGIVVTAPATLVLTWSHDTFEILMHVLLFYRFIVCF